MKITRIQTYKFNVPPSQPLSGERPSSAEKAWLFLKIETDAGITGWGEGSGEWLTPSVEATLQEWSCLLIDRDPLPVAALTEDITDRLPWKGGPVFGNAIAAINAALYDIAGKAWGVPVHTILGGKRRDRVRVYSGGDLFSSPEAAASASRGLQERGYAGIKGNPLESRRWPMDSVAVDHCVACLASARDAVGRDFDLLLDAHGSPQPELSIEFARKAAPYAPLFLEEPVKVGSIEALEEVSSKSPIPVATGEKLFTVADFKPLVDRRACAFLQPDVTHCFGITTLIDIAKLADRSQMLMAPHNAGGPLCFAASVQADAAMPNFLIQESSADRFDQFTDFVEHDWTIGEGHVNVSDAPGLGVEVKEADIAGLPYTPYPYRQYRHEDGSWKGW